MYRWRMTRLRVATPVAALLALMVCGCAASMSSTTARPSTDATPAGVTPPKTVSAYPLPATPFSRLRNGSAVGAGFTGVRVFVNRLDGFAIADLPQAGDATYPVATSDGGTTWRTDGPVLHIPAANGGAAVGQPGVAAPRIYFAWCAACNDLIDITPDAGKHWWAVRLPGQILSLTGGPYIHAGLTAVVEGPTTDPRGRGASLWVYLSTNGRRWRYEYSINAVS